MPAAELTKHILADGLKELMQSLPLGSISVGDITKHCGISRNTFYYHFQDKYDLVNWIFYTEVTPNVSKFDDLTKWSDGLIELGKYMQKNKAFYIHALQVDGQNSLSECLSQYYQTLIENTLLNTKEQFGLCKDDVTLVAKFYTHALIGTILDWARLGMKTDPEKTVRVIEKAISAGMFSKSIQATIET